MAHPWQLQKRCSSHSSAARGAARGIEMLWFCVGEDESECIRVRRLDNDSELQNAAEL